MKKVLSLGLAIVALAAAYAYPTLAGPTGLGVLPTADVVGAGQWDLAVDYYSNDGGNSDNNFDSGTVPIRLLYGLGNQFEIGASYRAGTQFVDGGYFDTFDEFGNPVTFEGDRGIRNMWGINAKWLTGLDLAGFCWSLGAQYLQGDTELDGLVIPPVEVSDPVAFEGSTGDYKATQVYFVGTRSFTNLAGLCGCPPSTIARGTFGINWTRVELELDDIQVDDPVTIFTSDMDSKDDAFRIFLGLDVTFNNRFTLAADFQTKAIDNNDDEDGTFGDNENTLYSVVARYPFSPNFAGQVGFSNEVGGVFGGDDGNFFVGLDYRFGAICPPDTYGYCPPPCPTVCPAPCPTVCPAPCPIPCPAPCPAPCPSVCPTCPR